MDDLWLFLSIPFISAAVGYGTNWVCIKMMCYPIEFWGIKKPYLGWQGVVPRRAPQIAGIQVDLMTKSLISVEEIFDRIDSKKIAEHLEPVILQLIQKITDEVMTAQSPKLWESVPIKIKDRIFNKVKADSPAVVKVMMDDIKYNIEDIFDLKEMVMDSFVKDRSMLVRLFQEIGYKEFAFVQNSGLWFGFLFGCIQMVVWFFYQESWILPLCGVLVGTITNWLAINMIFSPKDPVKVGPFTIQGLFIKRQDEVATDFGVLMAGEILNSNNIVNAILKGSSSDRLFELIQKNVKRTMDESVGFTKPFITFGIGTKRYIEIKNLAVDRIMENIPDAMKHIHDYTEEAMDINVTLREKMTGLTPQQFEGMLRPAFEADEWQLVALGAVIGGLVGWGQLVFLFGMSL